MTPFYFRLVLFAGAFLLLVVISLSSYHRETLYDTVDKVKDKVQGIKHERLAYATFLAGTVAERDGLVVTPHNFTEDIYLTSVRLLGYHLMHKPSTRSRKKIPFVVLVTDNVPESTRAILRKDGATVVAAETVKTGDWFQPDMWRWNDVMTKLRLWQLTQYDRVLFLDSDTALIKPLDGVFDDPGASIKHTITNPVDPIDEEIESSLPEEYLLATFPEARHDHSMPVVDGEWAIGPDYFNAGFFMMKPSEDLYEHYVSLMSPANGTETKFDSRYPEQNLLNYAHRRNGSMPWQNIATNWNVFRPTMRDVELGVYSLHAKWWGPKADLIDWFAKEEALMEGYYNGRDEEGWEEETGWEDETDLEVPITARMKRWMKRN